MDEDTIDPYWDLAWHEKVASYGDPDSQFFMAQVFEQGKLVPKNIKKAIEYYQRAGVQGHIESCLKLGELIPDEAEKWYLSAANQNDAISQIRLSQYYEKTGDKEKAILWLEKAMHILFPDVDDLTTVSPDLKRLKDEQ